MKTIFKTTLEKLQQSNLVAYIDRDRGQLDRYQERPAVKFPCALLKVNFNRRKNIHPQAQLINATIQIRVAFESPIDQHNLQSPERLERALAYYDVIESIENLFQAAKFGNTEPWECLSTVDEDRPDFDVVKITFTTNLIKEF